MEHQGVDYQLTPAGLYCRNNAEHVIQIFKNHLVVGLYSPLPTFPLNLWGKLLPHAVLTLNILWPMSKFLTLRTRACTWSIQLQENTTGTPPQE